MVWGCDIGRMCKWYGVVWCDVVWGNVVYDVGCGGMGGVMCWCGVNVEQNSVVYGAGGVV